MSEFETVAVNHIARSSHDANRQADRLANRAINQAQIENPKELAARRALGTLAELSGRRPRSSAKGVGPGTAPG